MNILLKLNNKIKFKINTYFTCKGSLLITLILALTACVSTPEIPKEMRKSLEETDCSQDQCIDFIYLHGSRPAKSGTHDDEQESFNEQIDVLHDWVSAEFYTRPEIHQGMLQEDQWRINPQPIQFYWGDMSADKFQVVQELLDWSETEKGRPGFLTRTVQKLFITGIHDTFWISRYNNNRKVNLAIHDEVKKSISNGRKTVLFGHSAGAIAIQNYGLYHWRYIDLQELRSQARYEEVKQLLEGVSLKTCVRAMLESGTMEVTGDGRLAPRLYADVMPDLDNFREFRFAFLKEKFRILPEYTEKYCTPDGSMLGIVTYGNPSAVLELTVFGDRGNLFFYWLRYVLQNKLFWINVNHVSDPMGYSIYDGQDIPELLEKNLEIKVSPNGGFFISGSEDTGESTASAHSWYWLRPAEFAKTLSRVYSEGYQKRYYTGE